MKTSKQHQLLTAVNQLMNSEGWEPSDRDKVKRSLKKLFHALDVKNIKLAKKAIEELSKLLLK